MSNVNPIEDHRVSNDELVALWERTKLEPAERRAEDTSGAALFRASLSMEAAREVLGSTSSERAIFEAGTDACVRLLMSRDVGTTFLDVRRADVHVLVGAAHALAEISSGDDRAFRARKRISGGQEGGVIEISEIAMNPGPARALLIPAPSVSPATSESALSPALRGHPTHPLEPGVRVVSLHALQFDTAGGDSDALLEEIGGHENIVVEETEGHVLPPGDYYIFHEREQNVADEHNDPLTVVELVFRRQSGAGLEGKRVSTLQELLQEYRDFVGPNDGPL